MVGFVLLGRKQQKEIHMQVEVSLYSWSFSFISFLALDLGAGTGRLIHKMLRKTSFVNRELSIASMNDREL